MDRNRYRAYVPLPWSVPDLKEFLSGSWSIDRLVIDHARTTIGRLRGKATFRPSGLDLLYDERGTLIFGDHHWQAEQTYRVISAESGRPVNVRAALLPTPGCGSPDQIG
jgi:hypothetical protein